MFNYLMTTVGWPRVHFVYKDLLFLFLTNGLAFSWTNKLDRFERINKILNKTTSGESIYRRPSAYLFLPTKVYYYLLITMTNLQTGFSRKQSFSSAVEMQKSWNDATFSLSEILHSVGTVDITGNVKYFDLNNATTVSEISRLVSIKVISNI